MEFKVFDVCKRQQVLSGPLPLTPGAKLTWLGFSEFGTLSSYDSKVRHFVLWSQVTMGSGNAESGLFYTKIYLSK